MSAAQLLAQFDRLVEAPNAVPRLRRFILDLAVRGKLIEQDEGDEPASELLKRIQAERLRVLKKSIKSVEIPASEPNGTDIQLPHGWAWSKLGDLCIKTGSGSTPAGGKDAYVSTGVPFLRSQNVYDDGLRLEGVAFISEATHERMSSTTVQTGDLLLNITGGSIGRCAIVPDSFVIGNINQHVAIIRLALLESGRFLHSVICSDYFQKHIFGNQTGAGREGLPKNRMDEIFIPLAPIAEQRRIVAKVDELMALCDQLEAAQQERERRRERLAAASLQRLNQPAVDTKPEAQREYARFHLHHLPRLTSQPEHIKAMRRFILDLAVRGKLVEQEAEDEPATELLKQIRAEKMKLAKAGLVKTVNDLPPVNFEEQPFSIPASWSWVRLVNVLTKLTDGTHFSPVNAPSGDFKYITAKNIKSQGISLANVTYVTAEAHAEIFARCDPARGDVLYIKDGATTGVVTVNDLDEEFSMLSSVALLKVPGGLFNRLLVVFLRSPFFFEQMRGFMKGAAIPRVTLKRMGPALLPLPPLPEQHRIVAKVDELMALCDQLETQLAIAKNDGQQLLDAVLDGALGIVRAPSDPPIDISLSPTLSSDPQTGKVSSFMTTNPAKTVDQLMQCIDELGGSTLPDRLLRQTGLSEDVEAFYDLLREARDSGKLTAPLGGGEIVRRHSNAD